MLIRQRRWAGALGALLLAAGAAVTTAASPAGAAGPGQVDLTLLNINDWHGRIDANTIKFAGTVEALRTAGGEANTVLLSAGDNIGASLFPSAVDKDQPTIEILNALSLKTSAVGNHEFDLGYADLRDRVINGGANAKWAYLGANVYAAGTTTPVLPEYDVFDLAGIKVGVVGVVTDETPALVSPAGVAGLEFGDPVQAVNRVAAQLSDGNAANGEADVIVAEYHDGAGAGLSDGATLEQEVAAGGTFADIVTLTSAEVDVIFTGHTHKEYAWDGPVPGAAGRTRPIVQTGSYGDRIGKVVLTVDQTTKNVVSYTGQNVNRTTTADPTLVATYPRVAAVKTIVDAANAKATLVGSVQVGSLAADVTTAFLGGSYVNGVYTATTRDDRSKESTLGNLVADSMVEVLRDPAKGGAEIGVVNPGGLRAELRVAATVGQPGDGPGVITFAEANAVLPFANSLFTTTLTGAQFKTLLEQQWQRDAAGNVPSRPYLQLGLSNNVSYTFDPARAEGDRVTSITVNGAPIDPARGYRIGSFSFLVEGGDNFRVFNEADQALEQDSGLIDRDAWNDFLTRNSPVAPSFARRSAIVTPVPTAASVGQQLAFTVSSLDLTSIGSPANTSLAVSIGGVKLGDVAVSNGTAAVDLLVPVGTPVGAQTLTAVASPSGTTVTVPVTVADPRVASATTLATSRTTTTFGSTATATLTATVALADGSVPTGSVDLVANGAVLATVPLVNGVGTFVLPSTTVAGSYPITAVFADTNAVKGSTSAAVTVTVRPATSATLLLTDRLVQTRKGTPATLTAYVLLNTPAPATGTVTFKRYGVVVATVDVVNGRASYTLPAATATQLLLFTAEYSGTDSIRGSRSNPIPVLVR